MDEIDLDILSQLQENARLTMIELGKKVGLTSPSVTERVRRLEEQGVIKKYCALVSPEKLNKHVTAFILMEPRDCKKYAQFAAGYPDVIECHRIAGMYSYLTKVVTESVHTLEDYIDACLEYGKPTTLIVLSSPVERKPIRTQTAEQ
ncbi:MULTISPECIES: Lrp/AsnC family transcriptional regulator [unclassified Sporolactobacillus]|uniref:Lrp/AsnC family transcriptional regulator n=1 Tax=unclassified Sporolactobacillus TaxID=2628533 RepID=UPI00236832F8|nr:Lrp/AsnC family transcriptional regulator [Sporolactobacillus sp. CQH2019]MDD9149931.1 Lrp/AsnC family transcriptional regulator [Sporolactobacillus sp. CQH2019]